MIAKMIRTEKVSFSYDGRDVLKNVSMNIKKGEFAAILGHNGSGKSTLAKHFNGILTPNSGDVLVEGQNTKTDALKIRQRVGMVFQNPDNQIVSAIVEEDVAFAPSNLGVPPQIIRQRVDSALKMVGMGEYARHTPHRLSGGQKQRIAIAGVLAMKPECIVLDEPTAMLDPVGRKDVMQTLRRLHSEGITVVLITHNMDEAAEAQRIIVMNDGEIVMDGTPLEVFSDVERVRGYGLDVPQTAELLFELGLAPLITVDDAYDALVRLL